ncbi:unnamed protein product [Phyllotreta striolata]|uniref:protein-serine/threonine phosphatase n=1 Tax=Phyllotreta striolata TaxID=444603 RepID=A0A9N9U199_PHYSR|nr:unnamed protein product [Phyllotreta striolata]
MALVTVQRSPSSNNSPNEENSTFEDDIDSNKNPKSLSECYFAGKGTALVLPEADAASKAPGALSVTHKSNGRANCGAGGAGLRSQGSSTIQKHLQSMFYLLRPEETLKMAVKLESVHSVRTRYLVVVSRMGARGGEESCILGIDCNEKTTVGLVLRVLANTRITLDGDGGFSVSVCDRHHIFKPVSVQAMWSTLQTLHKVSAKARDQNYFQGGLSHAWAEYYENRIESDRSCLNEWHAMDNLESRRPPSPDSVRTKPTERDETEKVIRATLKEIMMSVDLDEVTSKVIRSRLEEELDMDLGEYKSFIDQEMLVILGQMDAPTEIFEHVYLGSEWNASNYEELRRNGVGHILNVTREIDNFFPGAFDYLNVRVYDDENTDLLKHWDDTFKYITKVKERGSKVLVHCKMGVSRSASVVIAYAMKACNWDFDTALRHVKEKRTCIKPNTNFLLQLETYQGILDAMKNKEKLQRSKSETNLKPPGDGGAKGDKNASKNETPSDAQTLSKSFLTDGVLSGRELRIAGSRPKSWSPDNQTTKDASEVPTKSPLSVSLEDVSQKSASKESIKPLETASKSQLARHVLMPCDNGETYSVSPNQIVHLPDTNPCKCVERKATVMDIASQFEKTSEELAKAAGSKTDTWDPGEAPRLHRDITTTTTTTTTTDDTCVSSLSDNRTAWTSSIRTGTDGDPDAVDPFSNRLDGVFEREEDKKRPASSASRQSSWSSYDSAVALGYHREPSELSRHSSWGSGDTTRTAPSRNSSWGSYDMRQARGGGAHGRYINEKDLTESTVEDEPINSSAISNKIDIPVDEHQQAISARLSVSAPEPSSMELVQPEESLSRSASNVSKDSAVVNTAQCSSVKRHKTYLENLRNVRTSTRKPDDLLDGAAANNSGKVKNLKKEFEAKSEQIDAAEKMTASHHHNQQQQQLQQSQVQPEQNSVDDVNLRNLIGMFESNGEEIGRATRCRRKQDNNVRYSCIEVSVNEAPRILRAPLVANLRRTNATAAAAEEKRPPAGPASRTASPGLVVAATVITAANKKKQQQQYGKSHPLAKLNVPPGRNSPVYNTM